MVDAPVTPVVSPSVVWSQRMCPSILRRKSFRYSVSLSKGQLLLLQFSVFQHDVGFSAYFQKQFAPDASNPKECIELQPYQYVLSSAGHCDYVFAAPADGSVSLCWDNTYSYFNKCACGGRFIGRKMVQIEMFVVEGEVPAQLSVTYPTQFGEMSLVVGARVGGEP